MDKREDQEQDRKEGAAPEAYVSVEDAIQAILNSGRQTWPGLEGRTPELNCQAAACVISERADDLSLDGTGYFRLERATREMPDNDGRAHASGQTGCRAVGTKGKSRTQDAPVNYRACEASALG